MFSKTTNIFLFEYLQFVFPTHFNVNLFGNMYAYEQELSSSPCVIYIYIYSRAEIKLPSEKIHFQTSTKLFFPSNAIIHRFHSDVCALLSKSIPYKSVSKYIHKPT